MSKRAIIIVYDGDFADLQAQTKIAEAATLSIGNIDTTRVQIYTLDENEINQALVAKVVPTEVIAKPEISPEEAAVAFIGTNYAATIANSEMAAVAAISSQYVLALMQHNDEKLIIAVRSIGRGSFQNVSRTILQKYHFKKSLFEAIQGVYNTCAGHIM